MDSKVLGGCQGIRVSAHVASVANVASVVAGPVDGPCLVPMRFRYRCI